MEPLVSIVIPTINSRKDCFERAVRSAMHQTHQNIEIIPVIGESNPGKARNIGIQKARGDYIAFLDDDDEWLPTKIEEQVHLIREKTAVLVVCWVDDRRFGRSVLVKYPERITQDRILSMFNLASTSAYLFEAGFLKRIENFDERFPSAQEYELAIRSSYPCSVYCVQKTLVIQNRSQDQITRDWKKKRDGLKLLLRKHKHLYMKFGLRSYIGFRLRFIGLHLLYLSAEVLGDRIYRIIIPMKRRM